MPLTLRWKAATSLPVEADGFRPEALARLDVAEISQLPVPLGNSTVPLGDLFSIEGEAGDGHLVVEGDLRCVSRLGQGMGSGQIEVRGDVGPHLGAGMLGGRIDVHGSAGDWAGAEMRGGLLHVRGRAGDWLGAAYPGSRVGMRDGLILVDASAGDHVGVAMRRGLVAVGGRMGDGVGRGMIAGSIFGFGGVGRGLGLGMKRGTIALFGSARPELLSTFAPSGHHRAPFVALYLKTLQAEHFAMAFVGMRDTFARWNGDLAEGGQGEVLVRED